MSEGQVLTDSATMPALHGEALAFDASRGRLVVFGGRTPRDWLTGTWEWDGARWHLAADSASSPQPRGAHAMGFHPAERRVYLFGGTFSPRAQGLCDTWAFDGTTWARAADSVCVTDRVRNAALVFEARAGRMLLVDGPAIAGDSARALRLWRLAGRAWELVESLGPRRTGFSAVAYDESRGVLVVPVLFDGPDAGVWEWDGTRWKHIASAGPSRRQTYALAYDSRLRRVVLIGGQASTQGPYLADAWTWDGAGWTLLAAPTNGPPGRGGATLLDDAAGARLLYFGGYNEGLLADLWALEPGGWKRLRR